MTLKYLSLFSGIDAASVAFKQFGFIPVGFSEINPFNSNLLKTHYPHVPNFGDITAVDFMDKVKPLNPDILIGGSPCQAFSLSGSRNSLNDNRGNLTLRFCEVADATKAPIIIWENVTGVLNTKDNAFGCFLAKLAGVVKPLEPKGETWERAGVIYGNHRTIAWRVLNSQYFDLAQGRQRVFLIAIDNEKIANGTYPSPVTMLFEINKANKKLTKIPAQPENIETGVFCTSQDITPRAKYSQIAYTLRSGNHGVNTIFDTTKQVLRKLDPIEMERLMGFPDNYTNVPFKGKEASYSDRAYALGNSFAVNIIHKFGQELFDHDLHNLESGIDDPVCCEMDELLIISQVGIQQHEWLPVSIVRKMEDILVIEFDKPFYHILENLELNVSEASYLGINKILNNKDVTFKSMLVPSDQLHKDVWVSIRNTMGIVNRIDRKNIKYTSEASKVLDCLNSQIYQYLIEKIKKIDHMTNKLINLEVYFLIKYLTQYSSLLDCTEMLEILSPKFTDFESNLGVGQKVSSLPIPFSNEESELFLAALNRYSQAT